MLLTIGDLVDDVVVELSGPIRVATDTTARIARRRGGSAANVAVVAVSLGCPARFVGQVGDDVIGAMLVDELAATGVDASHVRRAGRTATIVVLVDEGGERTMLPDRATCVDLYDPDPAWLDGVTTLHVPLYSFTGGPLAATTSTVVGWAHERGVVVSVDVSSAAVIDQMGADTVRDLLGGLRPHVVLANEDEADVLGIDGPVAGAVTIVKQGPDPVIVHGAGPAHSIEVPPVGQVIDTTGAGDAFAAGLLAAGLADVDAAVTAGCRAAATLITARR